MFILLMTEPMLTPLKEEFQIPRNGILHFDYFEKKVTIDTSDPKFFLKIEYEGQTTGFKKKRNPQVVELPSDEIILYCGCLLDGFIYLIFGLYENILVGRIKLKTPPSVPSIVFSTAKNGYNMIGQSLTSEVKVLLKNMGLNFDINIFNSLKETPPTRDLISLMGYRYKEEFIAFIKTEEYAFVVKAGADTPVVFDLIESDVFSEEDSVIFFAQDHGIYAFVSDLFNIEFVETFAPLPKQEVTGFFKVFVLNEDLIFEEKHRFIETATIRFCEKAPQGYIIWPRVGLEQNLVELHQGNICFSRTFCGSKNIIVLVDHSYPIN